jgi:transcription initiation factor TFIIB
VLKLSPKVQTRAMEILEEAIQLGLTSGKGPMGAAAAALYIASIQENERRTQRDVSEAAKVTEVTVRNRYKEFQERLNLEIEI